jgi:hypothetical protein
MWMDRQLLTLGEYYFNFKQQQYTVDRECQRQNLLEGEYIVAFMLRYLVNSYRHQNHVALILGDSLRHDVREKDKTMAVATSTKHRRHHETRFFQLSKLDIIHINVFLEKGSNPEIKHDP